MIAALFALATALVYISSKWVHRRKPMVLTAPLLVTPLVMIGLLLLFRIPYESYDTGGRWISSMIGPATVALAVPLYKNWNLLKRHAPIIVTSTVFGATLAFVSSALLARIAHLSPNVAESLLPRSTTTPIAMAISELIGGVPSLTAVFVLITGLLGMLIGPLMIRLFHIDNEIAQGILFGTSAHTAGTSKAFEFGEISGTVSSIAMILTAFITLVLAPWLITLLLV